jgi:hypothetical protein
VKKILLAAVLMTATVSAMAHDRDGGKCHEFLWWGCSDGPKHSDRDGPAAAPEIDPASALSGLSLLAGGLAVLRARRSTASKA